MLFRSLKGYHGFEGLSHEQCRVIRYSRAVFTQGVATTVSKGLGKLLTDNEVIEKYLMISSQAILEGYRKVYDQSNWEIAFLDEDFQSIKDI